ncbi:adenine-specific DNA-methyltransferase [Pedobacter cryoconitis]|uniref:site-specific DNA-methyltransferase (adenine-specific) n=1 Tax=Pedobacter cryoconitis TaxID=188932 RepID=A0A7W9DM76_9SPHI|nr:site-specific DNA-methyltransferase [Pedobacter cryoconitis]MBB5624111.1 adenine-specific DNA-methyltransferase [Pedobacter cryoconitis]
MPTLHWIGKDKVINHHMDVPFKVLEHSYGFNNGKQIEEETNSGNKIIHGDNLEALKALLPEYEGKIKCIYIDPPYNTGNEGWVYNDSVNDPKIKNWLGQVVGKEAEDLTRHDKWLCMMYPRLKLLHKLLSNDGVIFISIDENEISNLRLLMDEIFGAGNFIEQLVWNKRVPKNDKFIGNIHEYVLLFVKQKNVGHKFTQRKEGIPEINDLLSNLKRKKIPIPKAEVEIKNLYKKNAYDRGITLYNSLDENYKLWGKINVSWPNGQTFGPRYDVLHPKTKKRCKVPERGWRWTKDTFESLLDYNNTKELHDGSFVCGRIWFAKDENTQPSSIKYLEDVSDFLLRSIISTKSEGGVSLKELTEERFDYPKPIELIEILLSSINTDNATILDSFAGSGTTAHAVLNINKLDNGNRKFICIEMENYAETITAERVKRVIKGYGTTEGTNGSFDYYELGQSLFIEDGMLNELVDIEKMRQYIYYTETKTPFTNTKHNDNNHFLGKCDDTGYYFNYEKNEITTLDHTFLATMKTKSEQYVVYADNCLLTKEFMTKHKIIFKKIPRDITRF